MYIKILLFFPYFLQIYGEDFNAPQPKYTWDEDGGKLSIIN